MPRTRWTYEYERKCFDAWYLGGRPRTAVGTREIIPAYDEAGSKPSSHTLNMWIRERWAAKAVELDERIEDRADEELLNVRVDMLRRHQIQAAQVVAKALDYIISDGFDSSASAVQALFRGQEEERKTAGFSDLLEKLESMSSNQVRDQIINLINRATENSQIVEEGEEVVGLREEGEEVVGLLEETEEE